MRASVVRHGRVNPVPCGGHVPVHPVQPGLVTPVQCSRSLSTLPCRSRPPSCWSPPRCGGPCWSPPQSAGPRCLPTVLQCTETENGSQCSTWQPSFPFSPPAQSMACLISLPNTVLHWVSLTTGTATCSRTVVRGLQISATRDHLQQLVAAGAAVAGHSPAHHPGRLPRVVRPRPGQADRGVGGQVHLLRQPQQRDVVVRGALGEPSQVAVSTNTKLKVRPLEIRKLMTKAGRLKSILASPHSLLLTGPLSYWGC